MSCELCDRMCSAKGGKVECRRRGRQEGAGRQEEPYTHSMLDVQHRNAGSRGAARRVNRLHSLPAHLLTDVHRGRPSSSGAMLVPAAAAVLLVLLAP